MSFPSELVYATAALACAVLAAVADVRDRRIPNQLTGTALLAGLVLHLVLGGWAGLEAAALGGLIAGGVFMVFHLAGGMGAGDVKLIAALGVIMGSGDVKNLVIATMVIGAVFALALALWRGALRKTLKNMLVLMVHHKDHGLAEHPELNVRNEKTLRLPYAVPIAVASALVLTMHMIPGARL